MTLVTWHHLAPRQAVLNGRRLAGRYGETLASATLEAYSHLRST